MSRMLPIALFCSVALVVTARDAAALPHARATISESVVQQLALQPRVRVIVALREPATNGGARAKNGLARRAAIAATRQRVLDEIAPAELHLATTWATLPGFAAEISAEGVAQLAQEEEVAAIELDAGGTIALAESVQLINGNAARARGFTGTGVTVAIIDTGVQADHPDLAGHVVDEQCYCRTASGKGCCPNGKETQSGSGAARDDNGHGTNVAGIVASRGIVAPPGVAPGANIVAIRVADATGNLAYTSQLFSALDWLNQNHPEVRAANLSFSLGATSKTTCDSSSASMLVAADAVRQLRQHGTAFVVSSGNDGLADAIGVPACLSAAISVGAVYDGDSGAWQYRSGCTDFTSAADQILCASNSSASLTLLAPGAAITSCGTGSKTSTMAGTSQAAPHVAGALAVLFAMKPQASVDELQALLVRTGVPITDQRNGITVPRIDLGRAVDELARSLQPATRDTRRRAAAH